MDAGRRLLRWVALGFGLSAYAALIVGAVRGETKMWALLFGGCVLAIALDHCFGRSDER